jgi:hypothetical protein
MKKIWYILTKASKFRVVSPFYTSKALTYREAKFMKQLHRFSRIIMID